MRNGKHFHTFALVRILGNDLPPFHGTRQTVKNLEFILNNEPPLPDCKKHWILNRINDEKVENELLDLLRKYGQSFTEIQFKINEYSALPIKDNVYHNVPWFQFAKKRRLLLFSKKSRLLYTTNNNCARNLALQIGASFANWIFPWDGNCIVTADAWRDILNSTLKHNPSYIVTPMVRCSTNRESMQIHRPAVENFSEPQLGFKRTADARFNSDFYYGRRDKVELLWRLGVAGPWNLYVDDPWDLPRPKLAHDRQALCFAGWSYRLENGRSHLWNAFSSSSKQRNRNREKACLALLRVLDERAKNSML